jgi:uncharacterized protein YjiS (DUF1127 family)
MYDTAFKLANATCPPASKAGWSMGRQTRSFIARAFEAVATWHDRARQRRHLAALDDNLLKDIGLTRVDVARETSKPFWEE